MKKLLTLFVLLFAGIALVGCGDRTVKDITVTASATEVQVGDTATLEVAIEPANATDKTATYTSSNTSVATVSTGGVVTAVGVGTTTITVTVGTVSKNVTITVVEVPVASVTVSAADSTIFIGGTTQLTATVLPTNATNTTVTYQSSATSVATVNAQGLVTGVGEGSAVITASAGGQETTVTITVEPVLATALTLAIASLEIVVGGQTTITPTITPANATNQTVVYSTSNADVATVNASGVVVGVGEGSATITGTLGSLTATVTVQVNEVLVTEVQLTIAKTELEVEETVQLTATVLPTNATNKTVTFTSSNPLVATISTTGLITAVGGGSTTITATAGNVSASVEITVPFSGLSVDNLRSVMEALLESYEDSLTGSILIYAERDGVELTTEFAYNYTETSIHQLMYKQEGTTLASIYVRDGNVYMLRDGLKSYEPLTSGSATLIRNSYGFNALTSSLTAFFHEDAFYANIELTSVEEDVYTFALDLSEYPGGAFVAAGKDSIDVVVTIVDGDVASVEVFISYSDGTTGQTRLEFKGLGTPVINFPADLILYPAA